MHTIAVLLSTQLATMTVGTTVVLTYQPPSPPPAAVPIVVQVTPSPRPAPRPTLSPRPHPRPTWHSRPRAHVRHHHVRPERPSRLQAATAGLPGYRASEQRWVMRAHQGHWGTTNPWTRTIYLSPSMPRRVFFSVVAHEWGHIRTLLAYGGDYEEAIQATDRFFGGDGLTGFERAADCIARVAGATWTGYTSCRNASWQAAARRLMAKRPI